MVRHVAVQRMMAAAPNDNPAAVAAGQPAARNDQTPAKKDNVVDDKTELAQARDEETQNRKDTPLPKGEPLMLTAPFDAAAGQGRALECVGKAIPGKGERGREELDRDGTGFDSAGTIHNGQSAFREGPRQKRKSGRCDADEGVLPEQN